jgi:coenzyme F420-reducing hydrogenase beta subunit
VLVELLLDVEPLEGGVLVEPLAALPDGEVLVEPLAEPLTEPLVDGELGVVAEPEDEVAPEPGVARRSPVLSPHAVSMPAPSTMEIATAKAESLI